MTDTDTQAVEPAIAANPSDVVSTTAEEIVESAPTDDKPDDKEPEQERPRGVQKRLDELTRNWREAERREQALLRLLEQRTALPEAKPEETSTKPKTLADFEFNESEYQAYLFQQAEQRAIAAAERKLVEQSEKQVRQQRQTAFQGRESAFAKTTPDYMEVTRDPSVPITAQMFEVIADSEDGPALAYHLAKNKEVAESIAQLPALAQARELGRIEARLAYERQKVAEAKKTVSKAPDPAPSITAVDAATKVSTTSPDSDRMTDEEWVRAERKRTSRRKA